MKLKSITLQNFRGIKDLRLGLHPRLTVLVAENGGGKTTILDGIAKGLAPILRFLSSPEQRLSAIGLGLDDQDYRLLDISEKKPNQPTKTADYTRIEVEATNGLNWDVQRSKAGRQPPTKVGQTKLKHYCTDKLLSLDAGEPTMLPVLAYYGTQRGNIGIPERLRAPNANYDYPTAALFETLNAKGDFKEAVKWFFAEESSELRNNKGRSLQDFMLSPTLEAVRASITEVLGDSFSNPHFNKRNKFVVETGHGTEELQVAQLSMGYQSMLALAMDYARRLAVANPHLYNCDTPNFAFEKEVNEYGGFYNNAVERLYGFGFAPSIILIDEVDLHLHPEWQQRVLDDLMRIFPNTQFVVTTHSPQVLSAVVNQSIRTLSISEESGIEAHIPEQQTRGVENADILAKVMGVDPIPPVKEARWLKDYIALIETAQSESPKAIELRQKLEEHFGAQHPLITDCDRLMRFQKFKLKKKTPTFENDVAYSR